MPKRTTDPWHQLSGDWTISGVVKQMDSLSNTLQSLESCGNKKLHVDCRYIKSIDMSGLQLLHVWMECARMRGVEPQLVNLPVDMHHKIQNLGLGQYFKDSYYKAVIQADSNQ